MHRDEIEIPKPCDEPWENMSGCGARRHCARCAKSVYDLSEMTEDEVEQLMARRPPNLCVSYLTDDQGVVQLKRRTKTGVVVGLALSLAACSNPFKRTGGSPVPVAVAPRAIGSVASAPPPVPEVAPVPSASAAAVSASALAKPQRPPRRTGAAPALPNRGSKNDGY